MLDEQDYRYAYDELPDPYSRGARARRIVVAAALGFGVAVAAVVIAALGGGLIGATSISLAVPLLGLVVVWPVASLVALRRLSPGFEPD